MVLRPASVVEKKPGRPHRYSEADREAVQARARALLAEVHGRRVVMRWLASAVGRSATAVDAALYGRRTLPGVLDRIEAVLRAADAGTVVLRTHEEDPIPALAGVEG